MSDFTDAFAAAVANLKSEVAAGGGLTGDQVDAHIHAVTDPIVSQVTTIANSEADDATKVADIMTALNGFSTTFAPTPAPAPAPAPTSAPAQ